MQILVKLNLVDILNSSAASNFVKNAIDSHKVVVISKTFCPFCTNAKNSLKSAGIDFKAYEIESNPGNLLFPLPTCLDI